jgi:hypothetical protein
VTKGAYLWEEGKEEEEEEEEADTDNAQDKMH